MPKSTPNDSRAGPESPAPHGPSGPIFYASLIAALVGFGTFFDRSAETGAAGPQTAAAAQADLARERASPNVRQIVQWAVNSGDHAGLSFVVVDKAQARLFAFDAQGRLRASAPVLLGAALGDAPVAAATPAGRFVADTWQSSLTGAIVFVNGDVVLPLYALPSPASPGRGVQRLASERVEDKRISDGSLHVASEFYWQFLAPRHGEATIAYVLPEVQSAQEVFTSPGLRVAQSTRTTPPRRPS